MKSKDKSFWPLSPLNSIVWTFILLFCLLLILLILRANINWPGEKTETTVLIGIFLFSLLPLLLLLINVIIERGGVIEYGSIKIDFSNVTKSGITGFTIPTNIGVPGEPVSDSSTTQILDSLKQATESDTVVIDLEDGQAWWETRLLVLLAGAVRLKKPSKIVFIARDGGVDQCFQGWGYVNDLLNNLLHSNQQYQRSYYTAQAAAKQWELVEPTIFNTPGNFGAVPPQPMWMTPGLSTQHPGMAFNNVTGLPNEFFAEQLLASDLGVMLESQEGPKPISLARLEELFRPILNKAKIDESWPVNRQINEFFEHNSEFIAVTRSGKYSVLVSRLSALNSIVKTLAIDTTSSMNKIQYEKANTPRERTRSK